MFKWISWVIRMGATALLLSFLCIWTTGYIVNSYMESVVKQLDLPLDIQPIALSGVWGTLWGADSPPKEGTVAESGHSSAEAGPTPSHESASEEPIESDEPASAQPDEEASASPSPSLSPSPSPSPSPTTGEESADPVFNGGATSQLTDEQRQELYGMVVSKLNPEQLQQLSDALKGGLSQDKLAEVKTMLKSALSEQEYAQMMEVLQGGGKTDTDATNG